MTEAGSSFRRYRGRPTVEDVKNGAEPYRASEALATAVNTALAVGQPLLLTGDPGTGKTRLAASVAHELKLGPVLPFTTRSDSKGGDLLFSYDNMKRFYDAQVKNPRAQHLPAYRTHGVLGRAILAQEQRLVLIDEIDKAQADFANDLLGVLDDFRLNYDTGEEVIDGGERPLVVVTSNEERPLPHAFLRRCVFHHLRFPEELELREILKLHFESEGSNPDLDALLNQALKRFQELRALSPEAWQKRPSTSELLAWARALLASGVEAASLESPTFSFRSHDFLGALVKTRQDIDLVQRVEGQSS